MATTTVQCSADTQLVQGSPTTNIGTNVDFAIREQSNNDNQNVCMRFVLPGLTGTITKINLRMLQSTGLTSADGIYVNELTQTGWTELGATWNKYDGTTDWSAAGGDYSGTLVDNANAPGVGNWISLGLYGADAQNNISTSTFGQTINIICRAPNLNNSVDKGGIFHSKDAVSEANRPYLEITYTPTDTGNFFQFF